MKQRQTSVLFCFLYSLENASHHFWSGEWLVVKNIFYKHMKQCRQFIHKLNMLNSTIQNKLPPPQEIWTTKEIWICLLGLLWWVAICHCYDCQQLETLNTALKKKEPNRKTYKGEVFHYDNEYLNRLKMITYENI